MKERTLRQRLDRCALLKSYETRAYELANSHLARLYACIDDTSPMELMARVSQMWPDYNRELSQLICQRDKELADMDGDHARENARENATRDRLADAAESLRQLGQQMQRMGGTTISRPQPTGHLCCDYAQAKIAVYQPVGWLRRLMLRWCFGLRYEPEPFVVKPDRPAPTPPEKE